MGSESVGVLRERINSAKVFNDIQRGFHMILYFADKNFKILGTASTSLSGGYVITDDTKKEEVETGIATLDCTVAYTDDTRSDIESWCRRGTTY